MLVLHKTLRCALPVLGTTLCLQLGWSAVPKVGPLGNGAWMLPTAQTIRPAGTIIATPGRPVDLVLCGSARYAYLKDNHGLVVVDVPARNVVQRVDMAGGTSMHGIALSADGRTLYATNSRSDLLEYAIRDAGRVELARTISLQGKEAGPAYPCGVGLLPNRRALVCLSRRNTLAEVDLADGHIVRELPVGVAPWGVLVAPDGRTAFVTNWGGDHPGPTDLTAPSAGTPTRVDRRGVASSGSVALVDLPSGKVAATLPTGLHPCDMALSADGRHLYVANANSDTVTVLDVKARKRVQTVSLHLPGVTLFGSAPTGLALGAGDRTLYVACGGANCVAVVPVRPDGRCAAPKRAIATAWYPGAIACAGGRLFVTNVKGLGSRDSDPASTANDKKVAGAWNVASQLGILQVVSPGMAAPVGGAAAKTAAAKGRPVTPVPIPRRLGEPSVFKHVVYILKENRTYDQVFGDLSRGDGDPRLCIFGRRVTPNHHALAERFGLLDNYYCNGVISADGHSWATEGNVTDHLEKAFGGFTRSYTFGDDPLTYSSSGFLWDNALDHGRSFVNFGEMDYATPKPEANFAAVLTDYQSGTRRIAFEHSIGVARLRAHTYEPYPGWNLSIPDVVRADIFLKRLREYEEKGDLPDLTLIYLPNDHTGADVSPESYLADNDLALGRVVEGLSHSRFWPTTCIFVNEDDPQSGFDHVDGHRSLCLVISPYSRPGAVVRDFYNQTSALRTMEWILGLPPMNQMDARSPLMRGCFTTRADLRPYTALPSNVALSDTSRAIARLTHTDPQAGKLARRVRFDRPDESDDDALNRLIWRAARGPAAPYPASYAGAHGKGLARRHLKFDGRAEDDDDDDDD